MRRAGKNPQIHRKSCADRNLHFFVYEKSRKRLTNTDASGIMKLIMRRIPVQTSIAHTLSRRGCLVCKRQGFFSAAEKGGCV